MRGWAGVLLLAVGCASAYDFNPTPQRPMVACVISCPEGFMFRPQHMCRSGRRWFQQILVKGEHTTRGADGEKITDVWITDQGDYPKEDVERGSCDSYIQSHCIASGNCAAHPGEPDPTRGFH